MNEITVWLPWVGNLRLDEPPENLEFYVMKSFHDFTEGTAKVYEFEDKLHYLDNLRKHLHAGSTDEHVRRLVCKRVEHRMEEEGDFPDREDFLCIEFMEHCFDEGFMPFHDTYYFGSKSGKVFERKNADVSFFRKHFLWRMPYLCGAWYIDVRAIPEHFSQADS